MTSRSKLLLALMIVAAAALACASTNRSVPGTQNAGLEVRIYEVFGMDCPGCHGGLEKLLEKIPAVASAEANWVEKRVTVMVRPGAELMDSDVFDAIERANFSHGERVK